mgnify:CR=1 FL=1
MGVFVGFHAGVVQLTLSMDVCACARNGSSGERDLNSLVVNVLSRESGVAVEVCVGGSSPAAMTSPSGGRSLTVSTVRAISPWIACGSTLTACLSTSDETASGKDTPSDLLLSARGTRTDWLRETLRRSSRSKRKENSLVGCMLNAHEKIDGGFWSPAW